MIKALRKITEKLYYFKDGEKIRGANQDMSGDYFQLIGDCSGLFGDCSGLVGDCTGVSGYCTGVKGDIDFYSIVGKERQTGINIADLIGG